MNSSMWFSIEWFIVCHVHAHLENIECTGVISMLVEYTIEISSVKLTAIHAIKYTMNYTE